MSHRAPKVSPYGSSTLFPFFVRSRSSSCSPSRAVVLVTNWSGGSCRRSLFRPRRRRSGASGWHPPRGGGSTIPGVSSHKSRSLLPLPCSPPSLASRPGVSRSPSSAWRRSDSPEGGAVGPPGRRARPAGAQNPTPPFPPDPLEWLVVVVLFGCPPLVLPPLEEHAEAATPNTETMTIGARRRAILRRTVDVVLIFPSLDHASRVCGFHRGIRPPGGTGLPRSVSAQPLRSRCFSR